MSTHLRARFWVDLALGTASTLLLVLTLLWPDWIERFSPFSPDAGDGSMERVLVIACVVVTTTVALLARAEWVRARRLVTA